MANRFLELLSSGDFLLADGAIGTNLFAMGLPVGHAPELWNLEEPEKVARLHRSFIDAGADIVLTNSFGGNRMRAALHGAQDRVEELNEAAALIAHRERERAARPVTVAGSMGPTGELFTPLGSLDFDTAKAAFAEQAQALARGGVDLLWIETLSSREEVEAAVAGAATTALPIVCTLSFDTSGRTMMGVRPAEYAELCTRMTCGPDAFGSNCGVGPAELLAGLLEMRTHAAADAVLVAKANCGLPAFDDGAIRYDGTPELMARYACLARDAGARIIGGCCGTTPEHLRAMRRALDHHQVGGTPHLELIERTLGAVSAGAKGAGGPVDRARRGTGRRGGSR